jgi:uncharacterized protein YbaR (Trm112 family)
MESSGAGPSAGSAGLEPWVIDLLVCPVDRSAVWADSSDLVCNQCGRRYPVRGGIPNMLPDQSKSEH